MLGFCHGCILWFWAATALKRTNVGTLCGRRTLALYIKQPAPQTGSGGCVTSQRVPFSSLLHPPDLSSLFLIRLTSYLAACPVLTPAASADVMIHSVVASLKKETSVGCNSRRRRVHLEFGFFPPKNKNNDLFCVTARDSWDRKPALSWGRDIESTPSWSCLRFKYLQRFWGWTVLFAVSYPVTVSPWEHLLDEDRGAVRSVRPTPDRDAQTAGPGNCDQLNHPFTWMAENMRIEALLELQLQM